MVGAGGGGSSNVGNSGGNGGAGGGGYYGSITTVDTEFIGINIGEGGIGATYNSKSSGNSGESTLIYTTTISQSFIATGGQGGVYNDPYIGDRANGGIVLKPGEYLDSDYYKGGLGGSGVDFENNYMLPTDGGNGFTINELDKSFSGGGAGGQDKGDDETYTGGSNIGASTNESAIPNSGSGGCGINFGDSNQKNTDGADGIAEIYFRYTKAPNFIISIYNLIFRDIYETKYTTIRLTKEIQKGKQVIIDFEADHEIINYTTSITFNSSNWYIPQLVKITSVIEGITKLNVSISNLTTEIEYLYTNIVPKILNIGIDLSN